MTEKWGLHFNQHWVSKSLSPNDSYDQNQSLMYPQLKAMGGDAARFQGLWSDYQDQPLIDFNAIAFQLPSDDFQHYLQQRGYGANGAKLDVPFQALKTGSDNNISTLFNLGGIPNWAQTEVGSLLMHKPQQLGEFLVDFVAYAASQKDGADVLKSISGIQIFNEVNGGARAFQPGYGFRSDQQPHQNYFEIVDHAMHLLNQHKVLAGNTAPHIVAPNLGGAYSPGFWDALASYAPQHEDSRNQNGRLALEAVAIHPYGVSIRPDVDPFLSDTSPNPNLDSWVLHETLTYHRYMMPTDDRHWMQSMEARDETLSAAWQLQMYEPRGNRADEYFDRNTELGVERSAVKLTQLGYATAKIHISEFGATSFVGGTKIEGGDSTESLWDTVFADPYKYGFVAMNDKLPKATAENLQAESLLQAIGLIESWDFVGVATAYQLYDYEGLGAEPQFGLATHIPTLKPAGVAYQSYMQGKEIHLLNLSGKTKNHGVDIHLAARDGTLNDKKRDSVAHELVLLREGDSVFNAGIGDDIIFAGAGNDKIDGGEGFDKLYGGFGDDIITGGPGNDRVKGDAGNDVMSGGAGANTFVFAAHGMGNSGNGGHDVIMDFKPASLNAENHDLITIVGGYGAKALLSQPLLVKDTPLGVIVFYSDQGASMQLLNVTHAQLSTQDFRVIDADSSIDFTPF